MLPEHHFLDSKQLFENPKENKIFFQYTPTDSGKIQHLLNFEPIFLKAMQKILCYMCKMILFLRKL